MTVLGRRLRRDVLPLLLTYIGCAVLIALIQILSLVLASNTVSSININACTSNKNESFGSIFNITANTFK